MKKHPDWKRIGWTVYIVAMGVGFLFMYYFGVTSHWLTVQEIGWDGEYVREFPLWQRWGMAFLFDFLTTALCIVIAYVMPDIIRFYYHNSEGEK